jgi:hypothetical protein
VAVLVWRKRPTEPCGLRVVDGCLFVIIFIDQSGWKMPCLRGFAIECIPIAWEAPKRCGEVFALIFELVR